MKNRFRILFGVVLGLTSFSAKGAEVEKPIDPASSRVIWGPTALPSKAKKVQVSDFDAGFVTLNYSPSSNFDVGLQGAPPIGIYLVGGTFRAQYTIAPEVHIGMYGNVGTLGVFVHTAPVVYYGGGPMLTIGNSRRAVNFILLNYGASHDGDSGFATLPGMGGSIQVADRVKLNLEGYVITTPDRNKKVRAGAILYGVRIFSKDGSTFGDASFLAPIYPGVSGLYRWLPMGIPVIAFGFSW